MAIIRFGLIGVGRWGKIYIKTLHALPERCCLTHLCTSRPENAVLVPSSAQVVSDWRKLLTADCDAVVIATPPHTHAEILEACLAAGKPCIVEKPLCLDLPTAERIHRRVQDPGVPVLVNHTDLFSAAYLSLKQALERANEPIRLIVSEGAALGPFRTHTPALWDWAPHDVSVSLDLLGQMPDQINVLSGLRSPEGDPELFTIRLDFPSKACAWIQAGRLASRKVRRLSVFTETRLYGLDELAPTPLTVAPIDFPRRYDGGLPELPMWSSLGQPSAQSPMAAMITYFLDGLAGGDRRRFGTHLALDVTRVLAACERLLQRDAGISV